jgi:hypothetical protein
MHSSTVFGFYLSRLYNEWLSGPQYYAVVYGRGVVPQYLDGPNTPMAPVIPWGGPDYGPPVIPHFPTGVPPPMPVLPSGDYFPSGPPFIQPPGFQSPPIMPYIPSPGPDYGPPVIPHFPTGVPPPIPVLPSGDYFPSGPPFIQPPGFRSPPVMPYIPSPGVLSPPIVPLIPSVPTESTDSSIRTPTPPAEPLPRARPASPFMPAPEAVPIPSTSNQPSSAVQVISSARPGKRPRISTPILGGYHRRPQRSTGIISPESQLTRLARRLFGEQPRDRRSRPNSSFEPWMNSHANIIPVPIFPPPGPPIPEPWVERITFPSAHPSEPTCNNAITFHEDELRRPKSKNKEITKTPFPFTCQTCIPPTS